MTDKTKKTVGKKEVKFEKEESSELVFGATSGNDMVNFGGDDEEFGEAKREPNVIHLHYQQRTTRKCLTIVQGLPDDLDDKKLLRAFKKMFHCNGTVVEDEEKGLII